MSYNNQILNLKQTLTSATTTVPCLAHWLTVSEVSEFRNFESIGFNPRDPTSSSSCWRSISRYQSMRWLRRSNL